MGVGMVMSLPPSPPSLSGTGDAAMMEETLGRSSALTMASRKRRKRASAPGPAAFSASARRTDCGAASRSASARPLSVGNSRRSRRSDAARLLHDIALVDQLLEHAGEALLGDGENVEQVGHPQARVAIDEMQHPVMRPAEAEILEDGVGVAGEIAIGEEQELGEFEQLGLGQARRACAPRHCRAAWHAGALARGAFPPRARVSVRSVMLT